MRVAFGKGKLQTLTQDEVEKVKKYVEEISGSDKHAFILDQHHGAFVFVAAGWWHAVRNIQDCVKYAVEFLKHDQLPVYAQIEREVRPMFGLDNAKSYISVCQLVLHMFRFLQGHGV